MKTKINQKFNSKTTTNRFIKSKANLSKRLNLEKSHPKKFSNNIKKNSKKELTEKSLKEKKCKFKSNTNLINTEDSSTNCFSGIKKKNIVPKLNYMLLNEEKKDDFGTPLLITKESDTESLFINFKLGERGSCNSYTESTLRSDAKIFDNDNENENKTTNIKLTKKNKNRNIRYNYCDVDENIGLNEMDSLEIYDFADENNVDYVLKNLSVLSGSKSGKDRSSILLEDINGDDEDINNDKFFNEIKIFNTKHNLLNINSKLDADKNKEKDKSNNYKKNN